MFGGATRGFDLGLPAVPVRRLALSGDGPARHPPI
jgi:hypothetical protein